MFEKTFTIPQYSVDANFNLRIKHLFEFLTEMGSLHSDHLGMTNEKLLENGFTWMLYQVKYKINRLPKSKESVKSKTWVSKSDRLKIYRETNLYDENDNLLVASTTVWLVIDIEKMSAVRLPKLIKDIYEVDGNPNFDSFEKFDRKILDKPGENIEVYKSDIDYNHHVNYGVYLRWIVDSIDIPDEKLKSLEAYYVNQVFKDSKVDLRNIKNENTYIHQVISNGEPAVYGKTQWEG